MKIQIYLAVIGSILVLGAFLPLLRPPNKTLSTAFYAHSEPAERFQRMAAEYAERTRSGPIAAWEVYGGEGEEVFTEGLDSQGRQAVQCVFYKNTGLPLSILCIEWNNSAAVDSVAPKRPRDLAKWWLKRVFTGDEGEWRWIRDGNHAYSRYCSYWQGNQSSVALTVNTRTGNFIALRFNSSHENAGSL